MQCISTTLLLVLAATNTVHCTTDVEWAQWKLQHNKFYRDNREELSRRVIWNNNYKYIVEHNAGNHSYTLALNHFADLVSL